tara:strand:+ start:252 stop:497 length:246 start_codon:yes stop_codon:yes gene_type:complete
MNLRQSILDANQVRMDDQYRAYNKVLKGHALETTTVNDALAALTPDAAVALVCHYISGADLTEDQVKRLARAANDRQWALV